MTLDSHTRHALRFLAIYGGANVALTATAIYLAWASGGWGALWFGLIASPIAHAILLLAGLVSGILYRRHCPLLRKRELFPLTVAMPTVGCAAVIVSLFYMDLHGC